jgi:hypothetical protein
MTKKIGIIVGIIVMLGFLSGLNATTHIHIHNIWVNTNDDIHIQYDFFPQYDATITHSYINQMNLRTLNFNWDQDISTTVTFTQGDRILVVVFPADYPGIHDIDFSFPGPWQSIDDEHSKR